MPSRFVHPIQRATHQIALYLDDLGIERLTQGEAHILALLAHSSPLSIAELHRALGHRRSTLTSILDRLSERAMISRQTRETDRRSFAVSLTPRGRKAAGRISRHLATIERKISRRIRPADKEGFDRVLAVLENIASR